MTNNKVEATFYDPGKTLDDFPVELLIESDFPVALESHNVFPVEKSERFSGPKTVAKALSYTFMGLWVAALIGAVLALIAALLWSYVIAWMTYPFTTLCATLCVVAIYVCCHVAVKRGFKI